MQKFFILIVCIKLIIHQVNCDFNGTLTREVLHDWFSNLNELTRITLLSRQIQTIDVNAFDGLTNLTYLNLAGNEITLLNSSLTFKSLINLKELYFESNKLTRVSKNDFFGLTNLTMLGLSQNRISNIENGSFNGLISLDRLYLSSNEIASIEQGVFSNLTNLTYLEMHT